MKQLLKKTIYPLVLTSRTVVDSHAQLWTRTFAEVWEPLPLDKKFAWVVFINHTIAIITILEVFLLKKR